MGTLTEKMDIFLDQNLDDHEKDAFVKKVWNTMSGRTAKDLSAKATAARKASNAAGSRTGDRLHQEAVNAGKAELKAKKNRNIARIALGSGVLAGGAGATYAATREKNKTAGYVGNITGSTVRKLKKSLEKQRGIKVPPKKKGVPSYDRTMKNNAIRGLRSSIVGAKKSRKSARLYTGVGVGAAGAGAGAYQMKRRKNTENQ